MLYKNNENGFSLVELVISIAILLIISGAVIQLFVTSAHINHEAEEIDKANTVAYQQAEVVKKNIVDYVNQSSIISYYDKNWAKVSSTSGASYALKTDISRETNDTSKIIYYPEPYVSFKPSYYSGSYTLTVKNSDVSGDAEVILTDSAGLKVTSGYVKGDHIGDTVVIYIYFDKSKQESPVEFTVKNTYKVNNQGVDAQIFIIDDYDPISVLKANDCEGISSLAHINFSDSTEDNSVYNISVKAYRIGDVTKPITEYSTKRYISTQ